MTHQKTMTEYVTALLDSLIAAGVCQAVISPGSRSTPVALLLHRDPRITYYVAVDERSAAFFALGLAKASHQPVLLLCTSGTAAANYYPAICEAKASQVPLIVLTTDRPPELREVGAPQAMNQYALFGPHVKRFVELTVPENTAALLRYSQWQGHQAVQVATQAPQGPVHLNLPLREPLLPDLTRKQFPSKVMTQPLTPTIQFGLEDYQELFEKKGLIVVGEERTVAEAQALLALAEYLNWPIVGDPLTNLANCGKMSDHYLRQADLLFADLPINDFQPEVVLRFGRLPISKHVMQWLTRLTDSALTWFFVDEGQQWLDQLQQATILLSANVAQFWQAVQQLPIQPCPPHWLANWQQVQQKMSTIITEAEWLKELSETSAVATLPALMPVNTHLFVSNSNAIRMLDRFGPALNQSFQVWGNRGVNGIDGIVSTAAGIAAATNEPVVLVTGDLALFHDMNGLQLIKAYHLPVTIVLLNNQGGGIFSFLSQRTLEAADFNPLFATPLQLSFEQVAALYGATYHIPTTLPVFHEVVQAAVASQTFQLIEVTGTFAEPVAIWEDMLAQVNDKIGE